MTWLIGSAILSELDTLRAFVSKAQDTDEGTRGRIHQQAVLLAPLGIGSVEVAITLTRLFQKHVFEQVWFVGTAGIFLETTCPIGEAAPAATILPSHAPGERLVGTGFSPIFCDLTKDPSGLVVWSSNGVSESDLLIDQAVSQGAQAENLELWGLARACQRAQRPFGAFLGISNVVGPEAHQQWRQYQARAASAACMLMAQQLKNQLASS